MNKKIINVCVPFPNGGEISPRCVKSLIALKECKDLDVHIYEAQGATISVLRNAGINGGNNHAVKQSDFWYDYFLSIDSDIEFSTDDVLKLIADDKDIISGFYQYRKNTKLGTAGISPTGNKERQIIETDFINWDDTGLKEVDWVGAGFLLVKREVLENMEYPYFRDGITEFNQDGIKCAVWHGEDVGFCYGAAKAGYKIYVDCDVKVNHLIIKPFSKRVDMRNIVEKRMAAFQIELQNVENAMQEKAAEYNNLSTIAHNIRVVLEHDAALLKEVDGIVDADTTAIEPADAAQQIEMFDSVDDISNAVKNGRI